MAPTTNPEAKRSPVAAGLVASGAERMGQGHDRDLPGRAGPYAGS